MSEWTKLDWFVLGAVIGYAWNPLWRIIKKIIEEAKIAKRDW